MSVWPPPPNRPPPAQSPSPGNSRAAWISLRLSVTGMLLASGIRLFWQYAFPYPDTARRNALPFLLVLIGANWLLLVAGLVTGIWEWRGSAAKVSVVVAVLGMILVGLGVLFPLWASAHERA